ncbi:hypothetical protein B0H13DRAFT_1868100 [Mycena leptocephala]|nr:hypothetical protein B0H13DRAFT_1868100 [Mycena leptocephala]
MPGPSTDVNAITIPLCEYGCKTETKQLVGLGANEVKHVAVLGKGYSSGIWTKLDRIAIFSVRFRLVSGNSSKIDLAGAAELHLGPQEPLDTEAPEKEHKNPDSEPFPAFLGRRL